ncbi:glyoxalase bleomycin resistance protein dioxygenase [Seminavis robusta]|uniref:Glyoxalase bleomycin resistance protein dioxygenase n=1 Tax=Seminavis robusta TaxID=568900 RepID=A0A9N8DQA4_9STRA|nr:glyoxalase bleomycin resistance protein dioxygenase [Seminavis robusta]|eukprot:Sro275_g105800.1 glyoxalase bleomycin resistance protein dioxygenase (264) ;mRNA; f:58947-59738
MINKIAVSLSLTLLCWQTLLIQSFRFVRPRLSLSRHPRRGMATPSITDWQSDLRFSHVDIIVDDLQDFIQKWCPRLGMVPSNVQTWGGPNDPTWSEFVFVFDQYTGALIFMVVEGKKGAHVDILNKYGHGAIYRLCFKTDDLEACFDHLKATGTNVTNLEGEPFHTFQNVLDSGKRILWLEREGELSMEILTAPIIDAGCEKLRQEVGLLLSTTAVTKSSTKTDEAMQHKRWHFGLGAVAAVGASFLVGVFVGRASLMFPKRS